MAEHQLFLSHAGEDRTLAMSLADQLRAHYAALGLTVEVFNTSAPAHRFEEWSERIRAGDNWGEEMVKWEADLRRYLETNIESSLAYILLVTPDALFKNSPWIRFEMQVARSLAIRRRFFFFPCTFGVPLLELPGEAMYFQGVELDKPNGFVKLTDSLSRIVLSPDERHA